MSIDALRETVAEIDALEAKIERLDRLAAESARLLAEAQAEIARLSAPRVPWPLFDATRDLILGPSFQPAGLMPESEFYPTSARGPIDPAFLAGTALPRWFARHPDIVRCMPDLEFYWPNQTGDAAAVTPAEVAAIPLATVKAIHQFDPKLRVGTYSAIERSLNHLTGGAALIAARTAAWHQRNLVYQPLFDEMDEAWVSLYPIVKDTQLALEADYIVSNVAMARRFFPRKPVYVVLWPDFHPTSGRTGPLPVERWRQYLELPFQHGADGAAIWLPVGTVIAGAEPWLLELQRFRAEKGIVS